MYCGNDIYKKIERYKKFYSSSKPGKILVKTVFPMDGGREINFAVNSISYTDYDLFSWEGTKNYFDRVMDWLVHKAVNHTDVDDDWIPELFVHLGTGVGGACFDETTVKFSPDTSWVHPSVMEWSDMERLDAEKETFWAKRLKDINEYVKEKSKDRFLIAPAMHYTPLDAANSLRGNNIFTDFYDSPENVKQLLEYCKQVIIKLSKQLTEITGDTAGGQVMWNTWMPGKNAIGMMEDTSNLCSPEIYADFGRDYTQEIITGCGGGLIHNHMLGRHQFRSILSIKELSLMNIANDPNCPRVIDVLENITNGTEGFAPIFFECTPEEVFNNIDRLKQIQAVLWVHCNDKDEAKRVVRVVRDISCIR